MAVLDTTDRAELHAEIMRAVSNGREPTGALKSEWRQLIDAADTFIDNNANAYNTTIPAAIRAKFTAAQKARALMLVIARRFLRGS